MHCQSWKVPSRRQLTGVFFLVWTQAPLCGDIGVKLIIISAWSYHAIRGQTTLGANDITACNCNVPGHSECTYRHSATWVHLAKPEAHLAAGNAFAACLASQAGQHHSAYASSMAAEDLSSYRLAFCCILRISGARFNGSRAVCFSSVISRCTHNKVCS